jgi:hypothetical protein
MMQPAQNGTAKNVTNRPMARGTGASLLKDKWVRISL